MQVLVADDHELARFALCEVLKRIEPAAEIFECDDLEKATKLAAENDGLDLIVLDLVMPGMTGVDGCAVIQRERPGTPVAIVSGQFSRTDVVRALRNGVSGFISKSLGLRGLENALRVVLAGDKYVPVELMGIDGSGAPGDIEKETGPFATLTLRQRQVLGELVTGRSNAAIALGLDISEATVKLHVGGILRKLGARNRTEAATMAMERGWDQSMAH